jgi:integrase
VTNFALLCAMICLIVSTMLSSKVTVSKVSYRSYRYRVMYPDGNKRRKKWFKIKTGVDGADQWAERKRKELAELGMKHSPVTDSELRAVHAFRELQENLPDHIEQISLEEVIRGYGESVQRSFEPLTCEMAADRLITRLVSEGKSKSHINSITYRLKPFMAEYGEWLAANVSTEIIDDFLTHQDKAPQTKLHYRSALHQLFEYAIQLRAAPSNPVKAAMKPKVKREEPGVLTPNQLAKLLSAADDDTVPGLAISFFAGLRRSEIERLLWSEVDLEEGLIEVKASKAKTAQRRFIPISENLGEWLAPLAQHGGAVVKSNAIWRRGIENARESAKLKVWPNNAGRHSYASYHLAEHKNSGELAMALGHPNTSTLFNHYRRLVTAKAAHTYWNIRPEAAGNVTSIKVG